MSDLFAWAREHPARTLKEAGMSLAADAQEADSAGWRNRAYDAILAVARQQATVHVDDVLATFDETPAHPNAWGAVWQRAIRDGSIARTGTVRESKDPKKHAHQCPVYRSKIFESEDAK